MNERKLTKSELKKREDIIMNMKGNKRDLVKKYGKDAEAVMYGRATNMAKKQSEGMKDPKLTELIKDALKNPKKADLNKDGKLSDYEEKRGTAIEKSMTKEGIVNENKQEAAEELQMIMDQLYELSDQAKMIFRNNFPGEYSRLDAYGALDFGTSSNRYDVTLEGALENLDMEDDDDDMMQEDRGELNEENIGLADLGERGYKAGTKAAYTYATLVGKLQNRPDKLAYNKGFIQGVTDELGSSLNEDIDLGHEDNEPHMLKGDLYRIGKYAMELYQMVDGFEGQGEVDFPHWWQSKIIKSKDMLVSAKHYLDFETKEPEIDAMVDVATEEDVIDENAIGINDRRLDDRQKSALDRAVRGDSSYSFGNNPYADDQLRYKYAVKMGFLEETIDAVVDATIDVVDEDTSQLGTDDDTGFQASLYTPNEMGAASVGRESASGAFESVSRNLAKKLKEGLPKK